MNMPVAFFVIAIVAIVSVTGLMRDYLKTRRREVEQRGAAGDYESKINDLEQRVRVLERIVTEKSHDLRREINEL